VEDTPTAFSGTGVPLKSGMMVNRHQSGINIRSQSTLWQISTSTTLPTDVSLSSHKLLLTLSLLGEYLGGLEHPFRRRGCFDDDIDGGHFDRKSTSRRVYPPPIVLFQFMRVSGVARTVF
jgi:hypothetical protein